jgi:hypothetical protein
MQSWPVGSSQTWARVPLGWIGGTGRRVIPAGFAPTQWMCVRGIAFTAGLSSRTGCCRHVMPPHVTYELTEMGVTLREATAPLLGWSVAHLARIDDARAAYDARTDAQQNKQDALSPKD